MTQAALVLVSPPDTAACRAVLEKHGKSFALAGTLFPRQMRDDAAVLYAFCRRADDAVDCVPTFEQPAALTRLRREVDEVYAGRPGRDPVLVAFTELVARRSLPRLYVDELVSGMEMDVVGTTYRTMDDLFLYAHRVAGVVGLSMCHVMGVSRESALVEAAHLGVAMQLTNIARDVREDWERGRLYLPEELIARAGAPSLRHGPVRRLVASRRAVARATDELLAFADVHYRTAEAGFSALPFAAALACRAAREVYAAIGDVVRANDCDPIADRAVVPKGRRVALAAGAVLTELATLPGRWMRGARAVELRDTLPFEVVLESYRSAWRALG